MSTTQEFDHLARRKDSPRQESVHVLQELALGGGRVAHDANVDVAPQLYALPRLLVDPAEQHQQDAALNLWQAA